MIYSATILNSYVTSFCVGFLRFINIVTKWYQLNVIDREQVI
jgi:hypothetical protein